MCPVENKYKALGFIPIKGVFNMPFPVNAIKGKANIQRKREKLTREATQGFSDLPDWMFYDDKKMQEYLEKNVRTEADSHKMITEICSFIRLTIRFLGKYEERE